MSFDYTLNGQELIIEEGTTIIPEFAFRQNNLFLTVVLPSTLERIGRFAFDETSLTEVSLPDSLIAIDYGAFRRSDLTELVVPDSVVTIGDAAFDGSALTSIHLPDSLTAIGDYAFYNTDLSTVTIPNSVQKLGRGAFVATDIQSVVVPASFAGNLPTHAFNSGTEIALSTLESAGESLDTTAPTVLVRSDDDVLTIGESANISFILSEPSTDFAVDDVIITGGVLSEFTGSGTTYTAQFTPFWNSSEAGVVTVEPGSFTDAAGNSGTTGSVEIAVDTRDTIPPTVTIQSDDLTLTSGETATITFTFSEALQSSSPHNFAFEDVVVTGGELSDFAGSGTAYTALFTPSANSSTDGVITIPGFKFNDLAGNHNEKSTKVVIAVDTLIVPETPTPPGPMPPLPPSEPIHVLEGTRGKDNLVGTKGMDEIFGLAGNDRLVGKSGDDFLSGGNGKDKLLGGNGNDTLWGGSGNDKLIGGHGNDQIDGQGGVNLLKGGNGSDLFYLNSEGKAKIKDFSPGVDKIWLEAVDQEYNEWNLDSSRVQLRAVSPQASKFKVKYEGSLIASVNIVDGFTFSDLGVNDLQGISYIMA